MAKKIDIFEGIVRRSGQFTESTGYETQHPFQLRNVHQDLPRKCLLLFDDGHYSEAAFEALKFLDKHIQRLSGDQSSGKKLMMRAFGGNSPLVPLNKLKTQSELDEQEGYQFVFSGIMSAIRNPKGHEYDINDDPDTCLDYLSWVSALIRRLQKSGFK